MHAIVGASPKTTHACSVPNQLMAFTYSLQTIHVTIPEQTWQIHAKTHATCTHPAMVENLGAVQTFFPAEELN